MGFDYQEPNEGEQNEKQWATYSDLFMVLSLVFLLLYVVASLRSGTSGLQEQIKYQKLMADYEDVKQQLEVYNTLKDNYLETGASNVEEKVYGHLMDKLSLLQDDNRGEAENLRKQADENEKKELALNKYQQLIRNIVNANMLSQSRIKKRDEKIKKIKKKSRKTVAKLKKRTQEVAKELLTTNKDLNEIRQELTTAQSEILKQEREKTYLVSQVRKQQRKYQEQMERVREEFDETARKRKEEFEQKIAEQKLSAKAEKRELEKYKEEAEKAQAQFDNRVSQLNSKIEKTKKDLEKAKTIANARKELAKKIKKAFKAAGVKADVDGGTGDVILNFQDEYFDTNKYSLKPGMKGILKKFMPVYSKTLFADKKIADQIKNVEVVGFASPTYKGKYIDPKSLNPGDRKAVDYNLDLSYYRARSIFKYIFDTDKMRYSNQKRLLPLVKVTGRSFLAERTDDRALASGEELTARDFCKRHDCKKAQRVIIRFNLEE